MVQNRRMKRAVRKQLSRRGRDVTLELREAVTSGSHGSDVRVASEVTTPALIDFGTGSAEWQVDIFAETEQDADIYIRDDAADGENGRILSVDDAGADASRIHVDDSAFRVVVAQSYAEYGALVIGGERL